MFINYWILLFASIFFSVFWLCPIPALRKTWLMLACMVFHYKFAGKAGVAPIIAMGVLTYFAGLSPKRWLRTIVIILCVLELIFYKYITFLLTPLLSLFDPHFAQTFLASATKNVLPAAPPLAISFFVFEFVHYLVDINRGKKPIRSVQDFTLFSIFWPSVVSGPVKRFEQFLPAVTTGCQKINPNDIQIGMMRISLGLFKKLVLAENLTRYIDFWQTQFSVISIWERWMLVIAISFRILCDFSGYSDIAIGFARLMGIKLPENFNWPYIATNLQDFWLRWHISLSTWIRDYIYIPLGGNQHGKIRRLANVLIAFAVCGLWHGAAWNFIFWGLYHGVGLVIHSTFKTVSKGNVMLLKLKPVATPFTSLITFFYVAIGWLYFFYPISEANAMLLLLIKTT